MRLTKLFFFLIFGVAFVFAVVFSVMSLICSFKFFIFVLLLVLKAGRIYQIAVKNTKRMNRLVILLLFINSLTCFSQIKIGGEEEVPKKQESVKVEPSNSKVKKVAAGDVELYFGTNWSMTNRKLVTNDNIFGDSLGKRADETGVPNWSYGAGFRTKLHKYVMLEGGISYIRNSETYRYEQPDTSHSYTNNYSYLSMPIKVYFTYGEKRLRWMVGIGGIPQMALKFKQSGTYVNSNNVETTETISTKIGYNSFVFSFVANAGIQYKYGTNWSIYILPEYRMQLTSSYLPANKYKHYGTAIGVSFGLVRAL